jgi:DNA-directed RNA polymerase subunit RPC12/RpoP
MDDWELLKKYWDFQYAVDTDVFCENCGNTTENWEQDHPRKFYLKAASLGGLVTFQCAQCSARILKKHFKDSIKVELLPFLK